MADVVLKSNAIFDSVRDEPFQGFVAIEGNRIIGIGPPEEAGQFIGHETQVLEFGDNLISNGFHDSHVHLIMANMTTMHVNLFGLKSEEAAAHALKKFTEEHPEQLEEQWLYGMGWYHVMWDKKVLPTKFSLDKYFPDKPVFLVNAEGHGVWVNSKALEIAGITKETPEPPNGAIGRLENGEPSGYFDEGAIPLVSKHAFAFSENQIRRYVDAFAKYAAENGVTSVNDMIPYYTVNVGDPNVYRKMEEEGKLGVKIHSAVNLFDDLEKIKRESLTFTGTKVRANLVKQFADGVINTHTALLLEDYADAPGEKGKQYCDLENIERSILEAHKLGLSVRVHCIGDRSARFVLDCFEKALKIYGKSEGRHAIEHLEFVDEGDIGRFSELGVIPSVQPEHMGLFPTWEEEAYRVLLGEERAWKVWRFQSLRKQAGRLALGTDCPVVGLNPFANFYRALTRVHDDGLPADGWNGDEKLTVSEILKAYTIDGAYAVGREQEMGSLEVGKLADIIVIDRNLFTEPAESIREASIKMTMLDGEIVYSAHL